MGILVKSIAATLAGTALGLFATTITVRSGLGFDAVVSGPWTSWPRAGTGDADPYARAIIAKTGQVPLGSAEGLAFVARTDSRRRTIDPACDYVVSGPVPAARFWTLGLTGQAGGLLDSPSGRQGFTSSELVRDSQGGFAVTLSRNARPGNWLQVGTDQPYTLVLRLYDSPNSMTATAFEASELPAIVAEHCP